MPPKAAMPPGTADTLRIVMVASEAQPFSKTGGLADVTTSLSRALGRLGQEVTVFTPRYRGVEGGTGTPLRIRGFVSERWFEAHLHEVPIGPGARVMLVDCPPLYDRAGIYNENGVDYADNPTRFATPSCGRSPAIISREAGGACRRMA